MRGARHLSGLQPFMRDAIVRLADLLEPYGITLELVSGFRSPDEQARLYAIGRTPLEIAYRVRKQGRAGSVTDAPPGYSAHNYGLAVDLAPGQQTARAAWQQLGGGTVSWDQPHLEWPRWVQLLVAPRR